MPASIEEVVREVLEDYEDHVAAMLPDIEDLTFNLSQRIERYGAALHCRGGWTLAQAEVPALAEFIGDTPKEKK